MTEEERGQPLKIEVKEPEVTVLHERDPGIQYLKEGEDFSCTAKILSLLSSLEVINFREMHYIVGQGKLVVDYSG